MKTGISVLDSFINAVTRVGVAGRDKRLAALPAAPLNLQRGELTNLYSADDIVARLCDLPAQTVTRKWLDIAGVEDATEAAAVLKAGHELGIRQSTRKAITWGRLYGSALVIMMIDDGRPMDQPVDEGAIRSIDSLIVLDRWDLQIRKRTTELGPNFGEAEVYEIINIDRVVSKKLTAQPLVHHTRVLRFDGVLTPTERKIELDYWNEPAVTRVYEVVRDFSMSYAGAAVSMQNLGTMIYAIKGLAEALASDKDNLLLKRLQALDMAKSVANAVPVDADGEELNTLKQQLAGVDKILERFDIRLAAAIGWPVTVLMGRSPAGMNATGENDLAIFYDTMEGSQLDETPKLERFYRYLMLASEGPTGGQELDGWSIKWNKLWQESQGKQAETRLKIAQADALNIDRDVYSAETAATSHYAGDEFSIDINLDEEAMEAAKIEPADEIPGVDLRDPTGAGGEPDAKPADEAMAAGQITALQGVLMAFNEEKLTREQAISTLEITFQLSRLEAAKLVGPEIEKEPEPPTVPGGPPPPPAPPGVPPTNGPEPGPEPEPLGDDESVTDAVASEWLRQHSLAVFDAPPTSTQSVIVSKKVFPTAERARAWLKKHGFKTSKIDETEESFRFRQREPGEFKPGSFRTIELRTGVSAVIGRPKE
jgi:phage-related protein (TIGR01555 family)